MIPERLKDTQAIQRKKLDVLVTHRGTPKIGLDLLVLTRWVTQALSMVRGTTEKHYSLREDSQEGL